MKKILAKNQYFSSHDFIALKNEILKLGSYNGFSGAERLAKLRAMHRKFPNRSHPYYQGACDICGDSSSPVMPHSEDYSRPYRWYRPWMYALCRVCHLRLHIRFREPFQWAAYKEHVKRGGYGSDLHIQHVADEVFKLASSLANGFIIVLPGIREKSKRPMWWEKLS